jgi:pimeloyl-ACP methyl ester carboxylesterase
MSLLMLTLLPRLVRVLVVLGTLFAAGCSRKPPVENFDVGSCTLALVRSGKGGPTVVYEGSSGRYSGIESGEKLRVQLGSLTTFVTYARAGRSPSGPATSPRTLANVATELHTLLAKAGCRPPYVLVGASLGGIYVRAFATLYPNEVAGLVLVESAHERLWYEGDRVLGLKPGTAINNTIEVLRARPDPVSVRELEDLSAVWAAGDLGLSGKLPNVPLVVITGLKPDRSADQLKILRQLHGEVFASSSHGMHIVTSQSGHNINSGEPEMVATAVRWVVDAARAKVDSPLNAKRAEPHPTASRETSAE